MVTSPIGAVDVVVLGTGAAGFSVFRGEARLDEPRRHEGHKDGRTGARAFVALRVFVVKRTS